MNYRLELNNAMFMHSIIYSDACESYLFTEDQSQQFQITKVFKTLSTTIIPMGQNFNEILG